MLCLVVLESCVYTRALALFFGVVGLILALATMRGHSRLEGGATFCASAQLMLLVLVVVVWWTYTSSLVDAPLLAMLQLSLVHGVGLWLAVAATLLSVVTVRLSLELSGILQRCHLGQIHQDPCLVSMDASSPTSSSSPSSSSASSACLSSKPLDPLQCAANYRV
ncbi:hypothetical protein PINS_up018373 [Pythium insidiosum]|nr:hypothetical protein PINS_up018373 [Pythium insidiosum]